MAEPGQFQEIERQLGRGGLVLLALSIFLVACSGPKSVELMATPVIYHDAAVDPFAHLGDELKTTTHTVFYATNRLANPAGHRLPYGNGIGEPIHLGRAVVQMGDEDFDWAQLYAASIAESRPEPVALTLKESVPIASLESAEFPASLTPAQRDFVEQVNAQLAVAEDKELMLYVHGTKVDFLNACSLAAEVDHFAGRDFVGVAFAWPSHQNILSYLDGVDVRRAQGSAPALQAVIELLAAYTEARRINLLSYSAGCRVASLALLGLREKYPDLSAAELRSRFRIGSSIFAAADVPVADFEERLGAVSALSEWVVITVSDGDDVLANAKKFMGGSVRAGLTGAEAIEEIAATREGVTNLEIVDVSHGQLERGFDITGHHYWYRHPWVSSEIIINLRTDLPPSERGLRSVEQDDRVWFLPKDYPHRVRQAVKRVLGGRW